MSAQPALDPSIPFLPSEIVLLNGGQFAKKVLAGNVALLDGTTNVSLAQLGLAMLAAAVLANEQAGAWRLEVRQKKAMLGLRKVASLWAVPTGKDPAWPRPSLEAELLDLNRELHAAGKDCDLSTILHVWLRADSASPWQDALDMIRANMAARGLLLAREEKQLKIFSVTRYELPASTAELAARQPVEPVKALLAACQQDRAQEWSLLEKEIKAAVKARTEQDTDSGADF